MLFSSSVFAQNSPPLLPGNVGIGTTSPTSLLYINNLSPNANPAPALTISGSSLVPNGQGIRDYLIINREAIPAPINIPASYYLIVKSDGKVGIGTATPSTQLEVAGETKSTTLTTTGIANLNSLSVTNSASVLQGLNVFGSSNLFGAVVAYNNLRINNSEIYFRSGSDVNHGLGFYDNTGQAKVFANTSINGPVLYGFAGGALATKAGGDKIALRWNSAGKVIIGNQAPIGIDNDYRLGVDGKVVAKEFVVQMNSWQDTVFSKSYNLRPLEEVKAFIEANKHLPEIPSEKEVIKNGISIGEMNQLLMKKIEELTLYVIQLKEENNTISATIKNKVK